MIYKVLSYPTNLGGDFVTCNLILIKIHSFIKRKEIIE